jgi:hypothetical protein
MHATDRPIDKANRLTLLTALMVRQSDRSRLQIYSIAAFDGQIDSCFNQCLNKMANNVTSRGSLTCIKIIAILVWLHHNIKSHKGGSEETNKMRKYKIMCELYFLPMLLNDFITVNTDKQRVIELMNGSDAADCRCVVG